MKDIEELRSRTGMSPHERQVRSRLRQLLGRNPGLLRGTLSVRAIKCGKTNCKCTRGERHTARVLVASLDGRLKQLYVPAALEPTVREWTARHQEIRELLEELSQIHWEKVKRRKA